MKHIVIIGNSSAGTSAAEAVRKKDNAVAITVISDEQYPAYNRSLLADVLSGKIKERDVFFRKKEFYDALGITLLLGKRIEKIVPEKNTLVLGDKTKIGYDGLIIATGVSPRVPKELKGGAKHGVIGLRSMSALKDIMELIPITHAACVWGGDVPSLKTAHALVRKGLDVKIVTEKEQLLPDILDRQSALFLKTRMEGLGVEVLTGQTISEVFGEGDVKAIKLGTGKVVACGLLIAGRDFVSNTRFFEGTIMETEKGIPVDAFLRSSVANIFAAGDVVRCDGMGEHDYFWEMAAAQGAAAGNNAVAALNASQTDMIRAPERVIVPILEVFGIPVVSLGTAPALLQYPVEEVTFVDEAKTLYKKMTLRDSKIVSFIGIGNDTAADVFSRLIHNQANVQDIKGALLAEPFDYALVKDLLGDASR